MNERFKELAERAKCYADENNAHYLQNPHWIETFEEKFAELIVAECVELCRRGKYDGREDMSLIQFNNGIRFCINAIDEHFGVEE